MVGDWVFSLRGDGVVRGGRGQGNGERQRKGKGTVVLEGAWDGKDTMALDTNGSEGKGTEFGVEWGKV